MIAFADIKRQLADPCVFAERILAHDHWQVANDIMRAIAQPRARVVVKSCHASSKTFVAADIVLWAAVHGHMVLTTAPTATQVEHILWPEIRAAWSHARVPLGGRCLLTQLTTDSGGSALGISTDQAGRLQGFHSKPNLVVIVIVDEAPGLRPELWAAIEGIAAGGDVRILALGNPTVASGPFYDMFSDPSFVHFTIDAFDTPNLEGLSLEDLLALPDHELDDNVRPYLVTRRWVRERYEAWGEDDAEWQSRVRGQFPDAGDNQLIARAWLQAARDRLTVEADAIYAGLDVAGPGEDENALRVRAGHRLLYDAAWRDPHTISSAGRVVAALKPYGQRLKAVFVDSVGIGYHFAGVLKDAGLPIVPVNVGLPSTSPKQYFNLKAELCWRMRDAFRGGLLGGSLDELTMHQLASIQYEHTLSGQIKIESKVDARKRGVASPDRAEALMLTFATGLLPHDERGTPVVVGDRRDHAPATKQTPRMILRERRRRRT